MTAQTPPILEHHTWRHLLRNLPDTDAANYIRKQIPSKVVPFLLSPPATLAYWIAKEGIDLPADRPVRILIVGAELADYSDNGKWYGLIGEMLGTPGLDVEFTFVGDKVHHDIKTDSHDMAEHIPKTVHTDHFHGELEAFFESDPDYAPDLIFGFHPDFYKNPSFFDGGYLHQHIAQGTPAGIAIFSEQEQTLEGLTLAIHGLQFSGEVRENPFHMEREVMRWARQVASLGPSQKLIAQEDIDELEGLVDMVDIAFHHSLALGLEQQLRPGLEKIEIKDAINPSMVDHEYRFIFDYAFVDTATGKIIESRRRNEKDQLVQLGHINGHLWHKIPPEDASDIDKIRWVTQVKFAYLLTPPGLQNDDNMLKRLCKRAEKGCAYSALAAARWYASGAYHIEQNYRKALEYAHQAGEMGLSDGFVLEATTIINKSDNPEDLQQAREAIETVRSTDNPDGHYLYYLMNINNTASNTPQKELTNSLEKAVERHHYLAAFELGMFYLTKTGDHARAIECLELSANYGHVDAAYNLGEYYFQVINQSSSKEQAIDLAGKAKKWFKHVADSEDEFNPDIQKRIDIAESILKS